MCSELNCLDSAIFTACAPLVNWSEMEIFFRSGTHTFPMWNVGEL